MFSYLDEAIYEGLALELPRTIEENMRRGNNALNRVLKSHVTEWMAMYRPELGWIGFEWGTEGEAPPEFESHEEFRKWQKSGRSPYDKGGYGFAHILAKRQWESEYIEQFKGQLTMAVAHLVVEIIAKGTISTAKAFQKKYGTEAVPLKATIKWNGYEVGLNRKSHSWAIFWVITAFKKPESGYTYIPKRQGDGKIFESADGNGGGHDPKCQPEQQISMINAACNINIAAEPRLRIPSLHRTDRAWERQTQDVKRLAIRENEVNTGWLYDL